MGIGWLYERPISAQLVTCAQVLLIVACVAGSSGQLDSRLAAGQGCSSTDTRALQDSSTCTAGRG